MSLPLRYTVMIVVCAFMALQPARAQFDLMNAPPADKLAASKLFTIEGDLISMFEMADLAHPVSTSTGGVLIAASTRRAADVRDVERSPHEFRLGQNFPNPFNMSTKIVYSVPTRADVRLVVYDIAGRKIAELVNGPVEAGVHAVSFSLADIASGTYYYRMTAAGTSGAACVQTRKMILMK